MAVSISAWAQDDDSVLIVSSGQLNAYWSSEKKVAPVYPTQSLYSGEQGCVAVGFIIELDGTTSSHRVVASFPSSNFDKSAIKAAKQFVYKPSGENITGEAVFTTNTFTYHITGSGSTRDKKQGEAVGKKLGEICTAAANKSLNADASKAGAG